MNTNYKSIILAIGLFLALSASVSAAPGDLDPTFGNGGIVFTRDSSNFAFDYALAMAIQPDGKIVVVGEGSNNTFNWDFAVVRYNPDGSLDTSFGSGGIVITQLTVNYDGAAAVAIQADGKIVVVGSRYDGAGGSSFAIVRYNPNGLLDASFNGTGIVITQVASSRDYAHSVAIQADGKIVVAGNSGNASNTNLALVRYNSNGTLDTKFNGTGKVITPITGDNYFTDAVAIQSDGKIIAAGGGRLVRYNADGSPDISFNGTGIVTIPISVNSVAIQADGKIVAVGSNGGFAFVRCNPNGTLDTSFGDTGKVITPVGNSSSSAHSVAIQANGKIVAVGYGYNNSNFIDFAVVRLNPNGAPDLTFNGTGRVITQVTGANDYASAVAIQADGKIVVAGMSDDILYDFFDFVVVRYEGGSNANIRTRFDFDGDGRADISVFRPSDRIWYLNQSANGFSATQFGLSTDKITPADYDGDGRTDISVYRDGTWYWLNSSDNSFNARQFGIASDIPVPADYYAGDGRAELAVYRSGTWWILNLFNNQINTIHFGLASDKPVAADYDGDGRADQAVYRNGEWHLNRSTQGYGVVNFGLATDIPVTSDYDGDGKTDPAVYRDGVWYLLQSINGFAAFQFGIASDTPAPADYDGDGKTDAAVYRDGIWYLQQSTNGFAAPQFGLAIDKPVPAAYLP